MLNKDEYNQEEYNDYYRQETQGAELNGSSEDKGGSIGKVIWLLLIIILAVAGYFGYKMMETSNNDTELDKSLQVSMDNLPQSVQDETQSQKSDETVEKDKVKKEVSKEKTTQNEVSNKVQEAVDSSASKMSPEEVAAIVAAVMKQVNQEKNTSEQSSTPTDEKQDKELINKLSTTEVDSVSTDLENALENIDINEDTHIDNNKKQVDVYNKVNVQNTKGTDSLSQLSELITNEIEDAKVSSTTTTTINKEDKEYSANIKKEVVFREKEMRIIVVRKGDTLGKIAKRAYGNVMDFKRIYKANPEITRPDRIYIGQKIRIPN